MFYHVYGPVEGRRHDWTMYCHSGLDAQLEEVLMVNGEQFCVYGDSGYKQRHNLELPLQGATLTADQAEFNQAMYAARLTAEGMLKEVKTYWTMVDFPRKMRFLQISVVTLYMCGMLPCNIRNFFYRNQKSQYFNSDPPTLDEFLTSRD